MAQYAYRSMGVFISWSGENSSSHELAKILYRRIKNIVQHAECYLSSKDIAAGAPWSEQLLKQLGTDNIGIICLSADSLKSPWIFFEAGAIAAKTGNARVCPLLIDLEKANVPPPLSIFQMKTLEKADVYAVVEMINDNSGDRYLKPDELRDAFDLCWVQLEPEIQKIKSMPKQTPSKRSDRELLEEILDAVRFLSRPTPFDVIPAVTVLYSTPLYRSGDLVSSAEADTPSRTEPTTAEVVEGMQIQQRLLSVIGTEAGIAGPIATALPYYKDGILTLDLSHAPMTRFQLTRELIEVLRNASSSLDLKVTLISRKPLKHFFSN